MVSAFLVTGFGIAASALHPVFPLLVGVAVALAFYVLHLHRIQLEPLSPEHVSNARKFEGMNAILLLFTFFLN